MKFKSYEFIKPMIVSILFTFIGCNLFAQTAKQHEVKAGETIYSISHSYGITEEELKAANPKISSTIMTGQKLNIPDKKTYKIEAKTKTVQTQVTTSTPATESIIELKSTSKSKEPKKAVKTGPSVNDSIKCKETYETKKKETLYSISQQFGLTVDELKSANPFIVKDKLKKGTYLCIPYTKVELEAMKPKVVEKKVVIKEPKPVSVAIIMPFGLNQEKKTKEAITMIDFYEGFMLAMSELKKSGVSGKIYAYDEEYIDSILELPQLKTVKLIVGAKETDNINKLISFTEKNNISLVVPMSSATSLVNNTRNVYQVNHKMESATYDKAFEAFTSMHPNANYIFINIEEQTDQIDNVVRMKTFLNGANINYYSINYQEIGSMIENLVDGKENIIIPSSGTKTAFDRIIKKMTDLELGAYDIKLFGYDDWQAFAEKETEAFTKYNCTFFTSFYNNPNATESYAFNQKFLKTFGREQFNTYPHYGMLGYDIANFFVKNMYIEGEDFAANIDKLKSHSLQNPMHFSHKNLWSGFVNNAIMFVQYNTDGTISVKQL